MTDRVIGGTIAAEDIREGDLIDWWRNSMIQVERIERPHPYMVCLFDPNGRRSDFAKGAEVTLCAMHEGETG